MYDIEHPTRHERQRIRENIDAVNESVSKGPNLTLRKRVYCCFIEMKQHKLDWVGLVWVGLASILMIVRDTEMRMKSLRFYYL